MESDAVCGNGLGDLNAALPTSVDGILGFEFLCVGRVAVNYRLGRMRVWPETALLTDVKSSEAVGGSPR